MEGSYDSKDFRRWHDWAMDNYESIKRERDRVEEMQPETTREKLIVTARRRKLDTELRVAEREADIAAAINLMIEENPEGGDVYVHISDVEIRVIW